MKRRAKAGWRAAALLALGLWLCGAAGEGIYYARPADLPLWARAGKIRFIRIDGGDIETMKALRTWWGRDFTPQEQEVLTNLYGSHFDRMLGLLEQARFNWIWVTWSNGWSLETEAKNREQLAKVIERCHERGIHVTAYLSAANMFWRDTFAKEPETRAYGLWQYGVPLFYAGLNQDTVSISWERRMADARRPGWRAYLVRKAALAVDAGVDGIFFDNLIGDTEAFRLLYREVQQMAREKAAASGRPKVVVYGNVHLGPGRFDLNDHGEVLWMEDGKDTPGVWDGAWQVDNARKIMFINAEKQSWQPLMYENDVYHCGHRERCIPSPAEQAVGMAEAAAFGAALSRNIEGRFVAGLVRGDEDAMAAWEMIGRYNRFFAEHDQLYVGARPAATVALLSRDQKNPAADEWLKGHRLFETKVLDHLDKGAPLSGFRVLAVPFRLPGLSREQTLTLGDFLAGGGIIFTPEPGALARKLGLEDTASLREWPPKDSELGPPRVTVDAPYVAVNLTRDEEGRYLLHLINYDHGSVRERVPVTLTLPEDREYTVELFSPDDPAPSLTETSSEGGEVRFTVGPLVHYVVARFAPKQ